MDMNGQMWHEDKTVLWGYIEVLKAGEEKQCVAATRQFTASDEINQTYLPSHIFM